jgi:Ran GTPase-activating protein (RanGAP) involved in mRNA processing and transport/GTPase SAR1 family protein
MQEDQKGDVSPLSMYGISLAVFPQENGCVLELSADVNQLTLLRHVLNLCQEELSFSSEFIEPLLLFETAENDAVLPPRLAIGVIGAAESGKTTLLKRYDTGFFEPYVAIPSPIALGGINKKSEIKNKKITVHLSEISEKFTLQKINPVRLSHFNVIIVTLDLTANEQDAFHGVHEILVGLLSNAHYPDVLIILAGTRCDGERKFPRESAELFAASLGIPYIECSAKTNANVSELFDAAIQMAVEDRMPQYGFRVSCPETAPEVLTHPHFYQRLNQRLSNLATHGELREADFRLELYRRALKFLETLEKPVEVFRFHMKNSESKNIRVKHEAVRNLSKLIESEPQLCRKLVDEFIDVLEEGDSVAKADAVKSLKYLALRMGIQIHIPRLVIQSTEIELLGELLINGCKSIGELSLSFGYEINRESVQKCANALKAGFSLRRLIIISEASQNPHVQFIFDTLLFIPELELLRLVFKGRHYLNELRGLAPHLEKHPTLLSLDVSGCCLSQASIVEIAEALCANTTLKSLNLSGNHLGGEATRALKSLVRQNTRLTCLEITNGHLVSSELPRLISVIMRSSQLRELRISRNSLFEVGVDSLLKGLAKNPQLRIVDVSYCFVTSRGMAVFLSGLRHVSTLTDLNLAGYDFSKNCINELCEFIQTNPLLRVLDLSDCHLSPSVLSKIMMSLKHNLTLKKINLSRNELLDEGAELVAKFIRENKTLDEVDLSLTQMKDAGLVALADALLMNPTLKQLYLRGNLYNSAAITVMLSALKQNMTLFSLDLGESVENKETLGYLIGFMTENTRIRAFGFMPKQAQRTLDLIALCMKVRLWGID